MVLARVLGVVEGSNGWAIYMHPADAAALPGNAEQLARQVKEQLDELLAAGVHKNRRGEVGPCGVCGKIAKLTFEHLPPKAAGNTRPDIGSLSPLGAVPVAFDEGALRHDRDVS